MPSSNIDGADAVLFAKFSKLNTAEISGALDSLRLPGSALGIRPVSGNLRLIL
jgi:hypothetical protein